MSLPASAFSSVVLPAPGGPSSSVMRPCKVAEPVCLNEQLFGQVEGSVARGVHEQTDDAEWRCTHNEGGAEHEMCIENYCYCGQNLLPALTQTHRFDGAADALQDLEGPLLRRLDAHLLDQALWHSI